MKNKTRFLLIAILLFSYGLFAEQVEFDTCKIIANNKLIQLGKSNDFSIIKSDEILHQNSEIVLFCVFELQPKGYIVTSAENDLPPIIAYSFTSSFYDEESGNILLNMLKTDIHLRLENIPDLPEEVISNRNESWLKMLNENIENSRFEQWPPEGTTPTGGWLLYNWSQSSPYNNSCPMDPVTGSRSVAGCPAIAMAQILDYHRTVNCVSFDDSDDYYHNYAGRQYWIDDDYLLHDFLSFPEMNVCLDTLAFHYLYEMPVTNTDKAALVFACGVAAQQVYTSQVSGTFGVNQAYQAFLKFNFDGVQLIDETTPDFYEQIAQNMMDALPVHFASVTPAWDAGHNFVVDGYNTDEYYHLNMGWGGSYNGWYLLPDEIPYGLTVVEGAIVDIVPDPLPTGFINGQITLVPAVVDTFFITVRIQNLADEYILDIEPDISGTTSFEIEVPIGIYSVTASYPEYETISNDDIIVDEQQSTSVDFSLCWMIPPTDLVGELNSNEITLNWQHSQTRSFQYFNIYRNINSTIFTLLDTTSQLCYADYINPPQNLTYGYYIIAIYSQNNESSASNEVYIDYIVTSADNDIVHSEFLGNYPNPFNPTTTISFSLTTEITELTELIIYNLKGQKVKTLINDHFQKGDHSIIWNGDDESGKLVSSGVYLYKLIVNGKTEAVKKCLLLK